MSIVIAAFSSLPPLNGIKDKIKRSCCNVIPSIRQPAMHIQSVGVVIPETGNGSIRYNSIQIVKC